MVRPGVHWTGSQRREFAATAIEAYLDPEPLPPWQGPAEDPAVNAAYRIARHAETLTESWYRSLVDEVMTPEAYVELVGVIVATVPVAALANAVGLPTPELPAPAAGEPTGDGPETVAAELNWVPVTPPPDEQAAVIQALSAIPAALENLHRMANAQYIPVDEMGDMEWTRGTLDRRQIELVAARLSSLRECFY